jgi:predicted PurR-regulated permease PerM
MTKGPPGSDASRPSRDWRELHLWQIQPVRDALLIAAIIGLISLGYKLSIVTVPILLAMALAYLFEPLVRRLTRFGFISRPGVALGIIFFAIVLFVVPVTMGVGFAVVQGVAYTRHLVVNVQTLQRSVEAPDNEELMQRLPPGAWRSIRDYIVAAQKSARSADPPAALEPDGEEKTAPPGTAPDDARSAEEGDAEEADTAIYFDDSYRTEMPSAARDVVRESTAWIFSYFQANSDAIGRFVGRQALGTGADAARAAFRTLIGTGYLLFGGFLTVFFFYFFCTGYGRVLRFWESLIPERRKARIFDLLWQMDAVIAAFIRGRLTVCFVLMVYFTIAYWLIGVPAPLILGPIVGFLSILPYVAGLGMPVAMLLMWLQPGAIGWQSEWWWIIGGPILVSAVSQVLDDYILTPAIQGKGTGMDVPSIVFASIAGGALAGVYGLLLAIPVAACLKILLREVIWPRFHAWAEGRSSDPLPIGLSDTET